MSAALRALVLASPARRPPISTYGPHRLLEALPWLLLASSLRVLAWGRPNLAGLLLWGLADLVLFLAFILVARRMIEIADGRTDLGRFGFGEQVNLATAVIGRVFGLLVALSVLLWAVGLPHLSPYFLLAFDGIAFDQYGLVGMAWSCALACLVLLMVVRADREGRPLLLASLVELGWRAGWLVPAIAVAAATQFGLSFVQGWARSLVYAYWVNPFAPALLKNSLFFVFVVGFAAVRLWLTLAILTFGLRASYRKPEA